MGIDFLTERDNALLEFINYWGKSYATVIAEAFFGNNVQMAKNRLNILKNKYGLIKFNKTGAMKPQNYITLTSSGGRYLEDRGFDIKSPHFSIVTMDHNMAEQRVYNALKLAGKNVERATVSDWGKTHNHTPDLLYTEGDKLVYVEIELTKKSAAKLGEIFVNIDKDAVSVVLYVVETDKQKETFKKHFPLWDKLRFQTIAALVTQAQQEGKIRGEKQ